MNEGFGGPNLTATSRAALATCVGLNSLVNGPRRYRPTATVQTAHLLAREQVYHTLLSVAADASTYASLVQTAQGREAQPL